jgi:hypothetical protein
LGLVGGLHLFLVIQEAEPVVGEGREVPLEILRKKIKHGKKKLENLKICKKITYLKNLKNSKKRAKKKSKKSNNSKIQK